MADGSKIWNIKNAIKSTLDSRETPRNLHKKLNKHANSNLYYNPGTGKIEHKPSKEKDHVDRELEREERIELLKTKLNEKVKDSKELSKAKRGKNVSIQQHSEYMSNYSDLNRRNIQNIISELKQLGCKVIPTENGYHVSESVERREYTNEDIKDMKLKIYEAYHDGRILSEDKDELFMLLEKAIENYNKESME